MAELVKPKSGFSTMQANQLTSENAITLALWCGGVLVEEHDALNHDIVFPGINVPTEQGMRRAQEGDWIIQRPAGDFLALKPDKFDQLFEVVVDG